MSELTSIIAPHIMRRIRNGDIAAFELLYKTYFAQLWEFAYRYVHDSDIAQDVVQDVLVTLWQKRVSLKGDENIPPYLYAAVRYRCMDAIRKSKSLQRKHDALRIDVAHQQHNSQHYSPHSSQNYSQHHNQHDVDLLEAELNSAVEQVLAKLAEIPRNVLMLRWKHGLTYAEIAQSLGISEGAAKVHATRGRRILAPYLSALIAPE